jgi:hypothetical protein
MDKKLKTKWVKALRSGKFDQNNKGYLHHAKTRTYCCLGVLRSVAEPGSDESFCGEGHFLSEEQESRFGLNFDVQEGLAEMNDDGVPFEVIAGFINEAL